MQVRLYRRAEGHPALSVEPWSLRLDNRPVDNARVIEEYQPGKSYTQRMQIRLLGEEALSDGVVSKRKDSDTQFWRWVDKERAQIQTIKDGHAAKIIEATTQRLEALKAKARMQLDKAKGGVSDDTLIELALEWDQHCLSEDGDEDDSEEDHKANDSEGDDSDDTD
jgi:hypothetical protein